MPPVNKRCYINSAFGERHYRFVVGQQGVQVLYQARSIRQSRWREIQDISQKPESPNITDNPCAILTVYLKIARLLCVIRSQQRQRTLRRKHAIQTTFAICDHQLYITKQQTECGSELFAKPSRFDTVRNRDRQTDRRLSTTNTRLCIASCGTCQAHQPGKTRSAKAITTTPFPPLWLLYGRRPTTAERPPLWLAFVLVDRNPCG